MRRDIIRRIKNYIERTGNGSKDTARINILNSNARLSTLQPPSRYPTQHMHRVLNILQAVEASELAKEGDGKR